MKIGQAFRAGLQQILFRLPVINCEYFLAAVMKTDTLLPVLHLRISKNLVAGSQWENCYLFEKDRNSYLFCIGQFWITFFLKSLSIRSQVQINCCSCAYGFFSLKEIQHACFGSAENKAINKCSFHLVSETEILICLSVSHAAISSTVSSLWQM